MKPSHAVKPIAAPTPRVSVIIPLYNKQHTIERAIRSVQRQSVQDFEVIVVDDGSTDASVQRLRAMQLDDDPRFVLVHQPNGGPGKARNQGARLAQAPHIAFLDADDEWQPDYLQRALAALEVRHGCQVFVAAYDTGGHAALARSPLFDVIDRSGPWRLPPELGPIATKNVVDACQISCVVMERKLFRRFGGFYEKNRSTFGEDIYLLIQLVFACAIHFELAPLVFFHVEDSELGIQRVGPRPVRPHLLEPEPLYQHCPPERLAQLRALFAYYRMLETEKFARSGDWRAVLSMRRSHPWPATVPEELRKREWKVPIRTLVEACSRPFKRRPPQPASARS